MQNPTLSYYTSHCNSLHIIHQEIQHLQPKEEVVFCLHNLFNEKQH